MFVAHGDIMTGMVIIQKTLPTFSSDPFYYYHYQHHNFRADPTAPSSFWRPSWMHTDPRAGWRWCVGHGQHGTHTSGFGPRLVSKGGGKVTSWKKLKNKNLSKRFVLNRLTVCRYLKSHRWMAEKKKEMEKRKQVQALYSDLVELAKVDNVKKRVNIQVNHQSHISLSITLFSPFIIVLFLSRCNFRHW